MWESTFVFKYSTKNTEIFCKRRDQSIIFIVLSVFTKNACSQHEIRIFLPGYHQVSSCLSHDSKRFPKYFLQLICRIWFLHFIAQCWLSLHLNKLWSKYFHSAKCNQSAGTSFNYLWTFFKTVSKNIQIIYNLKYAFLILISVWSNWRC